MTLFDQDGISGAQNSFQHFAITVPAGATSLDVTMTGSSGDADLYVRKGNQPTAQTFDCRPYTDTANESCSLPSPAAGTWYVSVNGYTAFSGLHITATAQAPAGSGGSVSAGGSSGSGGGAHALASDDFASSTWTGGSGFVNAWAHAGDSAISGGGARLRRSTGDMRRTVTVNGAAGLSLHFRARVQSFEDTDAALVRISTDGTTWTTVKTFTAADSDDTFHAHTVDLSAFDGANTVIVRFDAEMSSASDTIYLDDVVLSGR